VTNSPFAKPLKPMLALGILFPPRTSGLSFSLLPEILLSPDTRLSPDTLLSEVIGGRIALGRSSDTFRVPVIADPGPLPLDERLADRVPLALLPFVAVIPSPIAALGVDPTPAAFSGL
jgi:hypothetical protein